MHRSISWAVALVCALGACQDNQPSDEVPGVLAPADGAIYGVFAARDVARPATVPVPPSRSARFAPPHLARPALINPQGVDGQRPAREGVR